MKRTLAYIFVFLLLIGCVFLLPTEAKAASEGYYTYKVSDGKATITDCDTSISGDVVIPETLGGLPGHCYWQRCVRSLRRYNICYPFTKCYSD